MTDWIALSERRPEVGQRVELSWIGHHSPTFYTCMNLWSKDHDEAIDTGWVSPTHWRPAPSPQEQP